jgi:hypothetical protein
MTPSLSQTLQYSIPEQLVNNESQEICGKKFHNTGLLQMIHSFSKHYIFQSITRTNVIDI